MTFIKSMGFLLLAATCSTLSGTSAVNAHVPEALQHDIDKAQKVFQRRCTECHSLNTALSSRAYRDWLTGISQRHGKDYDWIPEGEAKLLFLHLVVHLEPQVKATIEAKRVEPEVNWKRLICLISGLATILLLATTFLFGHVRGLRRRWFKGHSYFATAALVSAILHGGYCTYIFVLT